MVPVVSTPSPHPERPAEDPAAVETSRPVTAPRYDLSPGDEAAAEAADDRLQSFLEQAAPLIARERGINARSRVLLMSLAQQAGLSDAEFDTAIAAFSSTDADEEIEQTKRQENDFLKFVDLNLQHLRRGVLVWRIESKLIDVGQSAFGMSEEDAQRLIRRRAAHFQLNVVTREEAQNHIAGLVEKTLDAHDRISAQAHAVIHKQGRSWGLSVAEVDDVVGATYGRFMHLQSRERRTRLLLVTALSLLAIASVGAVGWFVVSGFGGPGDSPSGSAEADAGPTDQNAWRQRTEYVVRMAALRSAVAGQLGGPLAGAIERVDSTDPKERAAGYAQLVRLMSAEPGGSATRQAIADLLVASYAFEPNAAAVRGLKSKLLAEIPISGRLDDTPETYFRGLFALRVAIEAASWSATPLPRAQAMLGGVRHVTGCSAPLTGDLPQDFTAFAASWTRHAAQQLALAAKARKQPIPAYETLRVVLGVTSKFTTTDERAAIYADFLAAVLPVAGQHWKQLRAAMVTAADAEIVGPALQLTATYGDLPDSELKDFLGEVLLRRAGLSERFEDPTRLVKYVRHALGDGPDPAVEEARRRLAQRRRKSIEAARKAWAVPRADEDDLDHLAEDIARLAYHHTVLATLLAPQVDRVLLDSITEREPAKFAGDGSSPRLKVSRPHGSSPQLLNRLDYYLSAIEHVGGSRRDRQARARGLLGVINFTRFSSDIDYERAERVVRYLLSPRSDEERRMTARDERSLDRWPTLKVAAARAFESTRREVKELIPIAETLAGVSYDDDNSPNVKQLMGDLLSRAAAQYRSLARAGRREGPAADVDIDRLQAELVELTRTQIRAHQSAASGLDQTETWSGLLQRIIAQLHGRLRSLPLNETDAAFVAQVPARLDAIDYVADDPLRRSVMLSRLRLRLFAILAAATSPDKAAEVGRIVAASDDDFAAAGSPLVQLRDLQAALLELSLLVAGREIDRS